MVFVDCYVRLLNCNDVQPWLVQWEMHEMPTYCSLEASEIGNIRRNRKYCKKNIFLNWWKSHNSLQEKKHVKLLLLFPNQQKNKIFKGKLYENVEPKHFPGALASSIPFRCPPARMAATWTCCLALWIGWQTTCNEQTCFHTCWSNVYIYIYIWKIYYISRVVSYFHYFQPLT